MSKHITITALCVFATISSCSPAQEATPTFAPAEAAPAVASLETPEEANAVYARFLSTYIKPVDGINYVAYGDVTPEDHASLKAYIASLETDGIAGLNRDEQMAFWYNLYNAKTIDVILENYPVSSIRKIGGLLSGGPWDIKNMNVTGIGPMSLNDIEHATLRANWDEPRIHYAVNCASFGCPNLKATPWTARTLEADMDQAAHDYINHPRGFNVTDGKVTASKIFDWYKVDFGNSHEGILAHARQYAKGDLKTALDAATTIDAFDYNWNLNAQ